MDKATFAWIEQVSAAAGSRPTAREQKEACRALRSLTSAQKLDALLAFVDRNARQLEAQGTGDWVSWVFADGVVDWREPLPWTRAALVHVLEGVVRESRVLPPGLVARAVEQYLQANDGGDAAFRKLVAKAGRSMWTPGSEGVNFKKAKERMTAALAATR